MIVADHASPRQTSIYRQEASELLAQIETEIQTLGQGFCPQKVYTLMRLVHTLKGAAATVGLDVVEITTQTLENAFKALCAPDVSLTSTVEGLIFEAYGCLRRLLSPPVDPAHVDELAVLDRVTVIDAKLQAHLGERFGQDDYLPDSAQLGVDVTRSIFATGVGEYLDELSHVLMENPDPGTLTELLQVQADVFIGLAESLHQPDFGKIAQTTLAALKQHPDRVVAIAHQALDQYRAGQAKVLGCDRTALAVSSVPAAAASASVAPRPLSQVFQQCQQELERLAQHQGKPVLIQTKTDNILIDQTVANQLYQPLIYLVRHAFCRDIEPPDVRQRHGKSAMGKIQLAAKQTERGLVVCVWDNGCGRNPDPIRQRVRPYIVRTLKGAIASTAYPGQGTCFTLTIPVNA